MNELTYKNCTPWQMNLLQDQWRLNLVYFLGTNVLSRLFKMLYFLGTNVLSLSRLFKIVYHLRRDRTIKPRSISIYTRNPELPVHFLSVSHSAKSSQEVNQIYNAFTPHAFSLVDEFQSTFFSFGDVNVCWVCSESPRQLNCDQYFVSTTILNIGKFY